MLALSGTVFAVNWNGSTSNDWNDPANWDGGVVPTGQDAYIGITGGGNPPFTATITTNTPQANDIQVARGGGPAILNHRAGIASTGNDQWMDVGTAGGTGTYNLADTTTTGGTLTGFGLGSGTMRVGGGNGGNGRLYVGGVDFSGAGGTGIVNVNTSGTLQIDNDLTIGTGGGTGLMNVDAGTITTGGWNFIGKPDNGNGLANGTLKMSGGTLTNGGGRTYLGMGNTVGRIELSGTGTYNNPGDWFAVGHDNLANATASSIVMTGNGALNTGLLTVGGSPDNPGQGTLTMSGNAQLTAGELWVGNRAGSIGTMTVNGGTVSVGSWFAVGRDNSNGVLTITGGLVQKTNTNGSLEITNFGAGSGSGTVNLDGGTLRVNDIVGNGGAAPATLYLNGGTLKPTVATGDFIHGTAVPLIKNGGAIIDTDGFNITINKVLAPDGASTGGLTKNGAGTLTLPQTNTYTGMTTVNGGTLAVSGDNFSGTGATINSGGTLAFGTGGASGMIDGPVSVAGGGALTFNRSDDLTYSATVTGAGTINKNGPNVLTFGASTAGFTGTTNINAGALILDSNQSSAVVVNGGGRLVPLANATGTLTVGSLSLNTNSTTDFEFAPGPTNDVIVVSNSGGLSFGSAFTFNFYDVSAVTPFSTNGTYTIIDYTGSFTGNLANLVVGNPVPGKGYALTNNVGTTSISLTISTVVLSEWNNAGGGLWTLAGNWTAGVPNTVSAEAVFGAAIGAPSTVDINGNKTVGKLSFDNINSYTIGGAGTLTLNNGATASTITVTDINGAGSHVINVPITATGNLSITTAAGTAVQLSALSGGNLTTNGAGTVTLNGAGTYGTTTVNGGSLNVGTGGTTGSLSSGAVVLGSGTSLSFNRSDNITLSNAISGGGAVIHNGPGTLTYTGTAATYTGATTLNAPFTNEGTINGTSALNVEATTLLHNASSTTVAGTVTVGAANPTSLTVTNTATLTANAINVGNGAAGPTSMTVSGGTVNGGNVRIGNTSEGSLTYSNATMTSNQFIVGESSTGSATMTSGRIDVGAWNVIGRLGGSNGTFTHSGGQLNELHGDFITVGENGTGTYNMTGTAVLNDPAVVDTTDRNTGRGNVNVGRNSGGVGKWNLSDNAVAHIRGLWAGDNAGSDGEVNIGGNSQVISSYDFFVGRAGTGVVNINGGSLGTTSGWIQIGIDAGGNGTLNVNAGSMGAREFRVGINSNGNVNVAGGTLNANQQVSLGLETPGRGTLSVSSGTMNVANGGILVSDGGLGVMNVSGGATNVNGNFIVGNGASGTGHVSVTGGSIVENGEMWIGQRIDTGVPGKGLMDVSAGSVSGNNWIAVGREGGLGVLNVKGTGTVTKTGGTGTSIIIGSLGGNGTANVMGGTLTTVGGGSVRLGEPGGAGLGSGILNVTSGGLVHADSIIDGPGGGAPNQVYLNNGKIQAATSTANFMEGLDAAIIGPGGATIDTNGNNVTINQLLNAPSGSGVTTIPIMDGGSGYVGQPIVQIIGDGFGASAVANLTDGVVTSITITNPGVNYTTATVTLWGGGETTPASLDVPTLGANVTTGGLTKIGAGTLTLTGDGDYGGATNVNAGTLEYTVSQTLSSLVIANGATVVLTETPPAPGFAEAPALEMEAASGIESSAAAVPEPGALGLLAAGALGVLGRRRRT